MSKNTARGFTLIEVMITVAIVAILASIALPAYQQYVTRSRLPAALDALSSLATRMEQRFQDTGSYACPAPMPTADNFTLTCAVSGVGNREFLATATGGGRVVGHSFTINHLGVRATTAHPKGGNTTCWTMKGSVCDS